MSQFSNVTGMDLRRLSGRKTVDRVLKQGNLWKGKHCPVRYAPGAPRNPNINPAVSALYVGTVVSGNLDKSAVRRNRMRRRCREALRVALKEHRNLPTLQLLLAPRSSSLEADFGEIRADIESFLAHVSHGTAAI